MIGTILPINHEVGSRAEGRKLEREVRRSPPWLKVSFGSSEEITNDLGMSVVPFVSRHSVYFANVPSGDHPSPESFACYIHGWLTARIFG